MKISFYGAAQTVTGSMHLVEANGKRILLDCGLYQGHRKEAFERNRNMPVDPATIDAVMEAKKAGAKIVAVSSSYWQNEMPADHFIRHPNKTNLFDYADVCIDDFNPVGDAVIEVEGFETPIAPVSNIVDFYIAHMLEIECVKECQRRGIKAPCWSSANTPGGDEKNAAYLAKYSPRIKML